MVRAFRCPKQQPKLATQAGDDTIRRSAAAAAVQLSFSWAPSSGLAAHSKPDQIDLLVEWRDQRIDDIAALEPAYIHQAIRV